MGDAPCVNNDDPINAAVEAVKARIIAALDALSPTEVRQLVAEIEEEIGSPLAR